jgi:hypothetical protein
MAKLDSRKKKIDALIGESKKIIDSSHVSLRVMDKGILLWKRDSLILSGRVNRETEKEEILSIISQVCPDIPLEDKLRVENR